LLNVLAVDGGRRPEKQDALIDFDSSKVIRRCPFNGAIKTTEFSLIRAIDHLS
jgi:hypothetical protein